MKYITIGALILPFTLYFNNFVGIRTLTETTAAIQAVNGGGIEYQISRAATMTPNIGPFLVFLSTFLIIYGILRVATRVKTKTTLPVVCGGDMNIPKYTSKDIDNSTE